MEFQTVWGEAGKVCLIDQTKLPHRQEIVRCASVADVVDAVRSMVVRGAPAIGVTAAYGIALAAHTSAALDTPSLLAELRQSKRLLDAARPTAVNLRWATERMYRVAEAGCGDGVRALKQRVLAEARAIHAEDLAMCHAIGEHGACTDPHRTGPRQAVACARRRDPAFPAGSAPDGMGAARGGYSPDADNG